MKKLIAFYLIFLFASAVYSQKLCSIISLAENNTIYVAGNLDAPNPNSKMWVVPAENDLYARICFGFDKEFKIAENGINEHGLFVDLNSVDKTNWKPDPSKPDWEEWEGWFGTGVPDGILAKCRNVDEALEIFDQYNLLTFANVKYHLADKTGKSVILEWADNQMKVIPRESDYLISTNFISSNIDPENYPCYRYKMAQRILNDNSNLNPFDKLKLILSSTSMEYNSPTQVSIIADLNEPYLTVYFYHNFEEPVELNLQYLFESGRQNFVLSELFQYRSYTYKIYSDYYSTQNN